MSPASVWAVVDIVECEWVRSGDGGGWIDRCEGRTMQSEHDVRFGGDRDCRVAGSWWIWATLSWALSLPYYPYVRML